MARALSRGRLPWHHGLPAITAEIDCGGQTHRITWRRGRLVLEDHDALAERALTSLGADPPVCIELLDAWRTERRVGLLFELLMRESTLPPAELLRRRANYEGMKRSAQQARANPSNLPAAASEYKRQLARRAARQLEREKRLWEISLIEALPRALRRTLGLSVIAQVERRWHDEEFREEHGWQVEDLLYDIVILCSRRAPGAGAVSRHTRSSCPRPGCLHRVNLRPARRGPKGGVSTRRCRPRSRGSPRSGRGTWRWSTAAS